MRSATDNRENTLHPHDIPGLPWQVVGTDLFEYGGQTFLLVTDFYLKYFQIEQLPSEHRHLTRQQLEENICEVWNPKERLSATTDRSTATPEICLATTMSSRNSLKSGDFPIQPAHRSILNQMPKLKEPYRPQNALLRRLQQRPI